MVILSPLSRVVPLPNSLNGLYMGVTNHFLTRMILQVSYTTKLIGPRIFRMTLMEWMRWTAHLGRMYEMGRFEKKFQ